MKKARKMPKDTNLKAKKVVDLLTGEEVEKELKTGKNQAAVELGRLGGLKGGKARAKKLSASKRKAIAKKGGTYIHLGTETK